MIEFSSIFFKVVEQIGVLNHQRCKKNSAGASSFPGGTVTYSPQLCAANDADLTLFDLANGVVLPSCHDLVVAIGSENGCWMFGVAKNTENVPIIGEKMQCQT